MRFSMDLADLLIACPGRVLTAVRSTRAQCKLDNLVSEILRIGDARGLFNLGEFGVEDLPVKQLSCVGVLVVLLLDPGICIGNVPVEQVLAIFAVGFDVGLLDFPADELGISRVRPRT